MLTYSDELAGQAQALADQCHFMHALTKDCSGKRMGQNMYFMARGKRSSLPTSFDPERLITMWARNERPNYEYDTAQCTGGCGHYTQVAWATSSRIGCGVSYCETLTADKYEEDENNASDGEVVTFERQHNAVVIVCNYQEQGNLYGIIPFLIGEPCTECQYNPWESGFKCKDDMCIACDLEDVDCNCPSQTGLCDNGISTITQSLANCQSTCNCNEGFWGTQCDKTCECGDEVNIDPDYKCAAWVQMDYCYGHYGKYMEQNCARACHCPDHENMPSSCMYLLN